MLKKNELSALAALALAVALMLGACSPRRSLTAAEEISGAQGSAEAKQHIPEADNTPPRENVSQGEGVTDIAEPEPNEPKEWFESPELPGEDMPVPSNGIMTAVTPLAASARPSFDLKIPAVFKVTRPAEKLSTTFETYFITGTSDPGKPVYIDGVEIERQGTKGTFGVCVDLSMGNNSFVFSQGDKSTTVNITRTAHAAVKPISVITQSSMYPAIQGGVKAGGKIPVECTAPSGATVIASFEGRSVTLQQTATANKGMPATYRGEIEVGGNYPADVTTKVGKVSYELRYDGVTTNYKSTGDIYVAGADSYIAVRVTAYQGFVYPDPSDPETFREKLKTGAADYVYSEDNTHYRLYSGGYIPKGLCEIIEGKVKIGNKVTKVNSFFSNAKRETFSFVGIETPAYHTNYANGVFTLTLYNTNGTPPVNIEKSRLFSSITATAGSDSSVTYTFTFKSAALYWGHQIWFDGTDTVLRFQHKPSLSSNPSRPLEGVTIMLDPGHGGSDPGALGVAGTTGPVESTLNLANAYAAMDLLTAQGATVVLTRYGDDAFELDERLKMFESSDADMYVSLHHNSLAESTDANKVTGTESYYHTMHSANAAKAVLDGYVGVTGRKNRGSESGYYRVTLSPRAPSLLMELGFICNPLEYEKSCDPAVIEQSAKGIVEGIKQALK